MCVTKSLKSLFLFFQFDCSFPIYLTFSISTTEVVEILKEILALVVVVVVVKLVLNVVVLVVEGVVLEVVMVVITV